MDEKNQNKSNEIINNNKINLPQINNNSIQINVNKDKKFNKVMKALLDNDNESQKIDNKINNDMNNDNNDINKNNDFKDNFYKYNFEHSEKIDSLNDLKLIKSSIGLEKIEPMNMYQFKIKNNFENKKKRIVPEQNIIQKVEEKEHNEEMVNKEAIENKNNFEEVYKDENNKKVEKGELDLTYNFDDDTFNVTQQQMEILDGDVHKIYNKYKNNVKVKNYKMNHPYLKYNLKEKANNILEFSDFHLSKEERQKRLSPLIEKQKIILEKIKKDNISRSNLSLSNNNDSDNQTRNKINKSNKIIPLFKLKQYDINDNGYNNITVKKNNYPINSYFSHNTLDLNNNINYNNQNNRIQRYQNLYNNGTLSTGNRSNISANDKNSLRLSSNKKVTYEPYTLFDYKERFDNNNNKRKLGGLGPNIGGEDWVKRQKKLEIKKKYSEYVKSDNEEDITNQRKLKIKLKNENNEISKTISSKKSSEFSNYNKKNRVIQTENNIINKNKIKLPLIKERFNYNRNNIKNNNLKRKVNNLNSSQKQIMKDNYGYEINQFYTSNGNEKDLKELIKQYEEYNGKF